MKQTNLLQYFQPSPAKQNDQSDSATGDNKACDWSDEDNDDFLLEADNPDDMWPSLAKKKKK